MSERMRAALYHGAGSVEIGEVDRPVAAPGEVLIEVHAAGICGTDAGEYRQGPHWYRAGPGQAHIPGHELAGQVVQCGDAVPPDWAQRLVACSAVIPCGQCRACQRDRPTSCAQLSVVGGQRPGGLAQYVSVPVDSCRALDELGLSTRLGALAQPLAVGVHAWRRGAAGAEDRILVVGAGAIGVMVSAAAMDAGLDLTICDVAGARLTTAAAFVEAASLVDLSGGDEALPAAGFDVVFECTGTPAGWASALRCVTRGGRVVLVGHQGDPVALDAQRVSLEELELVGTNALDPHGDFDAALDVLRRHQPLWQDLLDRDPLPLADLVAHGLYPLSQGRSERLKILFDPRR